MRANEFILEDDSWNRLSSKVSTKTPATSAIDTLKKDLKDPLSYDAIDHMMTAIAKKYNITPHDLHLLFVDKVGTTPDVWIRKVGANPDTWDEKLNELEFLGSPCTKDCSGHRAGYAWSQSKGGRVAQSPFSPSFNNGSQLHVDGK